MEGAGTKPSVVRTEAIAVLKEVGIDITAHRSKHVEEFDGQYFDYVLTVCDTAKESCPFFVGKTGNAPASELPRSGRRRGPQEKEGCCEME